MVGQPDDQPEERAAGTQEPVLPLDRHCPEREVLRDVAGPASDPRQPRHRHVPGAIVQRRRHVAEQAPEHWTWDPDLGFFTSGAFIGDYSGIAANDQAIYAAWTDGRDSNIVNTGVGETDVFATVRILGA